MSWYRTCKGTRVVVGIVVLKLYFIVYNLLPIQLSGKYYRHVTEISLKCFLMVIFTNIHLPSLYIMYFIVV